MNVDRMQPCAAMRGLWVPSIMRSHKAVAPLNTVAPLNYTFDKPKSTTPSTMPGLQLQRGQHNGYDIIACLTLDLQ